ncbi:hypothetical protein [Actinomadura litoris]|uniref:hypothetical protein n=1 Tax=Actinomadura litoris TaxID=2678616 RepID=UPI001FA73655|nr:hypothetical protein [Actinomadura litoris]
MTARREPSPLALLPTTSFLGIAAASGITATARELTLAGRLVPLSVGRRTYYRWPDVIAVMPPASRPAYATWDWPRGRMGGAR